MSQPSPFRSDFLRLMDERGYIHQQSHPEELDTLAAKEPICAYIGFDATADSLHVGSLVQIMLLRRLQQTGHKPVVVMGGGTTKVGDPSGKDTQRRLLSDDEIAANMASLKRAFQPFLHFGEGPADAVFIDNADWLDHFGYVQFLRDYGPHFTINRMLSFDSVRQRLEREQPLTFLEFNYMLMQSVDFLELHRRIGCVLQMGGSDQWGNILNGVELIRRVDQKPAFALTTPLITTSSGAKMGKTAAGAVWLSSERLSAYDYWQFWRNTEDADVGRFLRLFTDDPLDEIARLESLQGAEINAAKKRLADEATRLMHGEAASGAASAAARAAFEQGRMSADLPGMDLLAAQLSQGVPLAALTVHAGLAGTRSEARRLAEQGGLRINDLAVTDPLYVVTARDLSPDGTIKLQAGRRKIVVVRLV